MRRLAFCLLLVGATLSLPAVAHHSFALYDMTKQVKLVGTVKEFLWVNPHIVLHLEVPNGSAVEEWVIDGPGVFLLKRKGWSKTTFKPGDKVTVTIGPKRDGSKGGTFVEAILPDGTALRSRDPEAAYPSP